MRLTQFSLKYTIIQHKYCIVLSTNFIHAVEAAEQCLQAIFPQNYEKSSQCENRSTRDPFILQMELRITQY